MRRASPVPPHDSRAVASLQDLEWRVAHATAVEGRAQYNQYLASHNGQPPPFNYEGLSLTYYAPEINLCRDPRWGRCQESRGECPTLAGDLASAFVDGLQNDPNTSTKYLIGTAKLKDYAV